jgi:hypothetical protein
MPSRRSADEGKEMRSLRPSVALAAAVACLLAGPAARAAEETHAEPPITLTGVEGDYLRAVHKQIHWRWATKFIGGTLAALPATDPLNNPALAIELYFVIRWDGRAGDVAVARSSGLPAFDAAAVAAVRGDVPYPSPPLDLYADDRATHFHWRLARDERLCSGGELRRLEDPLDEALPRLLLQGRTKEALLRVARHMREGDPGAISAFARAWLSRPFADPVADVHAAAALARAGDRRQSDRLRRGLGRTDTVAIAAQALAASKVDVCALALPMLQGHDPAAADLGVRALRALGGELAEAPACVQALSALAADAGQPGALRAQALEAYAGVDYAGARRAALADMEAPDAALRAGAARAFARPGGGRPSLYRLEPLVHDPALEVRSAVGAALVQSCGDLAHDYLLPLFKEHTSQALLEMAPELGRQSSPGSVELLARMLKRNDAQLRLAVLAALGGRHDAPARALHQQLAESIKKDPHASGEARQAAYANAEADELLPLARDPVVGVLAFKALVRARRHQEAADWLVASFDRLPPAQLVDALGAWLASPPSRMAAATSRR